VFIDPGGGAISDGIEPFFLCLLGKECHLALGNSVSHGGM
jgi:hypothetical protein